MSKVLQHHRSRGFTLIELMVAMSLTVLIGTLSYRFFDASVRVQEQGEAAQRSLTALEQTWQLLASDLQNSINRPVVTPATGIDFLSSVGAGIQGAGSENKLRRPAMMSTQFYDRSLAQLLSRDGALLWFSRQGWVNPLNQQRSELQRVLYRLDINGNLYRDYWPEQNQDLSAAPEGSQLLLENVQNFQMTFLAEGQNPDNTVWLSQWPTTAVSANPIRDLPVALKISLEITAGVNTGDNNKADGAINGDIISSTDGKRIAVERIFLLAGV